MYQYSLIINSFYFRRVFYLLINSFLMNILVLGSGGREHAFAWKIKQSPLCSQLFIAPGNAGTALCGQNVNIAGSDFAAIKNFCVREKIDMVVVGPEDPLVNGIYDFLREDLVVYNIFVIGPSAAAAMLEGSKAFSKHFMERFHIPTARYAEFDELSFEEGLRYLANHTLPIVLKADGLAAGKGVVICQSATEAEEVFTAMIKDRQFGEASAKVVVEEYLQGIEVSVFVLTDGMEYKIIGHAKDYKRIGEGDTGPNTGGMGCVSPVPFVDEAFMQKVEEKIIRPTIKGIQAEKLEYKGFIFFGLMKVGHEPYVIEYNCRMGDPETEVVLPRLENDLVDLFLSVYKRDLATKVIEFDKKACCTVVAVSAGYPGDYQKNFEMAGLNDIETDKDVLVFHAGTKQEGDKVVTNGGRVLAVTSKAENIKEAVTTSLNALNNISFKGMYYRKDIGYEFE